MTTPTTDEPLPQCPASPSTWRRSARWLASIAAAACQLSTVPAQARPTAPTTLCAAIPDAPACAGAVPACSLCHESTDPPAWNAFGMALKVEIEGSANFDDGLRQALATVADADADGDGVSNMEELLSGSPPGVADKHIGPDPLGDNAYYNLSGFDPAFAFRRASILYCGRSPSNEESVAFKAEPNDETTLRARLHEQVSRCLTSAYWTQQGLQRLADNRIRPVKAIGWDTDIYVAGFRIAIADYMDDYRLWTWALTEDHDMRDLLTAQYHVKEDEHGALKQVFGVITKPPGDSLAGGQIVPEGKRAGMITTQWFSSFFTMFTPLPRTTAAQAYRAYLGADIAKNEGLRPVAGEPLDIDNKGVKEERCALCHSTLDPLSYVFAEYGGIVTESVFFLGVDGIFGPYLPDRPPQAIPGWNPTEQQPTLLGQPVKDLVEWSQLAASSDEFKRNMASIFFEHALRRAPTGDEVGEFQALWEAIPDQGYSANQLIHSLVDTLAFGGP